MPGALNKNTMPVVIPQPLQSKPSIAVNKDVEQVLRISSKPIIESPKSGSKKGGPSGDASFAETAKAKMRLSPGLVKIMSPRGSSAHRSSFGSPVAAAVFPQLAQRESELSELILGIGVVEMLGPDDAGADAGAAAAAFCLGCCLRFCFGSR